MKHVYSVALVLLVALFGFNAAAQDVVNAKISVAQPEAVSVTIDGQPVNLIVGENDVQIPVWKELRVTPTRGHMLSSITTFAGWEFSSFSSGSYSDWISGGAEGKTMVINTKTEAEFCDSHMWVKADDPTAVYMTFNGTNYKAPLSANWFKVRYSNKTEQVYNINPTDYSKSIYQVKVNDTVQPAPTYGGYNMLTKPGAKVEIIYRFPDVDFPVHIKVPAGCESFISSVKVDAKEVADSVYKSENFAVHAGSRIMISGDIENYKVNQVLFNGAYCSFYTSLDKVIAGETTIEFDVVKYQNFTKTIQVEGAGYFTLNGGSSFDPIPYTLQEGTNTIEMSSKSSTLSIALEPGYQLSVLKDGETDLLPNFNNWNTSFEVAPEGVLVIKAEPIKMDKKYSIYVDFDPATLTGSSYLTLVDYNYEPITLKKGYNVVEYNANMAPFQLSQYDESGKKAKVFVNGEQAPALYGSWYLTTVTGNDVAKIYYENQDPQPFNVTFANSATVAVEAEMDMIVPVVPTGEVSVMPGTHFRISAPEGKTIRVQVGNGEAAEGNEFEFDVDAATTVTIADAAENGVQAVNANKANAGTYNLEGIRVNGNNVAPGVYIENGTKVLKK